MKKERSDHARKEANRKQLHQEQQLRQSFATIHSSSSVPNATKGNYTQTAPPLSDDELDEDKANLMQFFTTLQAEANKLHRDSVFRALSNKQQLDIFVQIIEASHLTTSGHGNASTTTSIEECKDSSVVWLGTIHGAKGREWSRVYLVDADDNTYSDFRHNQVQDMSDIDSDDGGANEDTLLEPTENGPTDDSKNLIYVAVSRAKHSLTVLYRNGGSGQARQSTSDCRELSRYLRPIMTLAASGGVEYENLNSKPIKLSGVVQVSSTLQSNAGVYSGVSDVNYSGSKTTSGVEFLRASAYSQAPKTNAPVMPPYSVQPVAFNPVVPQPSSSLSVPRISTTSSTSFTSSHVQRQISSQMPKQIPSQIPPTISHTDEKENAANSQKSSTSSSSTSSSTTNTKVRFPPSSQLLANLKKSTTSSSVSRSVGTESGTAISTGSQKKANGSNFVDLT